MLLKLIKHDLANSSRLAFILGAIAIVLSLILGTIDSLYTGQRIMFQGRELSILYTPNSTFTQILGQLMVIPVAVAAAIYIAQFYRQSMFGKVGHLTMTMPVDRRTLLSSKLVVGCFWAIYAIIMTFVVFAITHIVSPYLHITNFFTNANVFLMPIAIYFVFIVIAAVALLFFCITLANCTFGKFRPNLIISALAGLAYGALYLALSVPLLSRFTPTMPNNIYHPDGTIWIERTITFPPLVGWQYGRVPIGIVPGGLFEIYIDLFFIVYTLAAAAIAVIATRYLLKHRVSL